MGTTQYYLGKAYLERVRGKRANNVERAINCFQLALQGRAPETDPQRWLLAQDGLGDAYANRVRGKRKKNVKLAVAAYRQALKGQSLEATPTQYRMTQRNLGDLVLCRAALGGGEQRPLS